MADPGFPKGGAIPGRGDANLLFANKCTKILKNGLRDGAHPSSHLDPPLLIEFRIFNDAHLLKQDCIAVGCVPPVQGLSVPFACVGSSDPVRVLRLYTTNTLDIL